MNKNWLTQNQDNSATRQNHKMTIKNLELQPIQGFDS